MRKTLNYGHTLGHAIESHYLEQDDKENLLHGEAIAIGMILATYLSTKLTHFNKDTCDAIKTIILNTFDHVIIPEKDIKPIIELMKADKKNSHGKINFVLLSEIGGTVIDVQVPNELIYEAFEYYHS